MSHQSQLPDSCLIVSVQKIRSGCGNRVRAGLSDLRQNCQTLSWLSDICGCLAVSYCSFTFTLSGLSGPCAACLPSMYTYNYNLVTCVWLSNPCLDGKYWPCPTWANLPAVQTPADRVRVRAERPPADLPNLGKFAGGPNTLIGSEPHRTDRTS